MARRPSLGGGTISPFGGGGVDFGAFNIRDVGEEAYLAFLKVQVAYNAAKATDDEYLAALEKYANALGTQTSEGISAHARLEETRRTVQRNVLVSRIQNGEATTADLVAFDKAQLTGLDKNSDEYRSRLAQYRSSQSQQVSEQEKIVVDQYGNGKMTTAQLQKWYQDTVKTVDNNPELVKSLNDRINDLASRATDERDSRMVQDYNDGKVSTGDFLAYATSARSRYAAGTTQAQEWDRRIQSAADSGSETNLLYRYNLSQQYADLERFVKSNGGKPAGGTSTSTKTRVILGSDGAWHTVKTTSTTSHGPSKSEVAAYQKLKIQLDDAKKQMAQIAAKLGTVGGFIGTPYMQTYYQKQLTKFAKGSADWYRIQGKLDDLNDRLHQESVFAKQGIKITYPHGGGGSIPGSTPSKGGGGGGAAAPSMAGATWNPAGSKGGRGGGGISLDQFMRAIASQESGGRYDARNKTTGAYGKYQILPSNWASWARKAGLSANAPMTPENQEKVARAAFERLAKSYKGDWSRVAAAWFGGVGGERNRGPRTNAYVSAIMSKLGTTAAAVSGGGYTPGAGGGGGVGGSGSYASAPAPHATAASTPGSRSGPLAVVVGTSQQRRTGATDVQTRPTGFPANLDSRQFEKFYANFERAFLSGQESFVDTTSGRAVHYYIGDDPDERRDRMRQLDDLRIRLYDERAVAYQGTASELTAANARNEAYKDVARHEYQILDTESGNPKTFRAGGPGAQANPIATGLRILDAKKNAIEANLAAAKAAFARGDIQAAYSELQMAQHMLVDANTANLAGYKSSAEAAIKAIQTATGGIDPGEALGSEGGGKFADDLNRLRNFDDELNSLFDDKDTTQLLSDIKGAVKTDNKGNVLLDPNGDLTLQDDAYWELGSTGQLTLKHQPPTYDATTNSSGHQVEGTVTVKVKSGTSWIDAQAKYSVGAVGAFVDATGQRHPIQGKIVQYRNADGSWTTFYENPLAPGKKGSWSNKPYTINTPKNFKIVDQGGGKTAYQFTTSGSSTVGGRGATSYGADWTFTLVPDDKTGTYSILGQKGGGFMTGPQEITIGAGDPNAISLFADAGFIRDSTGTDGGLFDASDQPVFGGTEDQYQDWQDSFKPPASRFMGGAPGAFRPDTTGKGGTSLGVGGAPGAYRPAGALGSLPQGGRVDLPFRDFTDAEQDYIRRGQGGPERRDDTRHGLPPIPAPSIGARDNPREPLPPAPAIRPILPPPTQGAPGAYRPPPASTSGGRRATASDAAAKAAAARRKAAADAAAKAKADAARRAALQHTGAPGAYRPPAVRPPPISPVRRREL